MNNELFLQFLYCTKSAKQSMPLSKFQQIKGITAGELLDFINEIISCGVGDFDGKKISYTGDEQKLKALKLNNVKVSYITPNIFKLRTLSLKVTQPIFEIFDCVYNNPDSTERDIAQKLGKTESLEYIISLAEKLELIQNIAGGYYSRLKDKEYDYILKDLQTRGIIKGNTSSRSVLCEFYFEDFTVKNVVSLDNTPIQALLATYESRTDITERYKLREKGIYMLTHQTVLNTSTSLFSLLHRGKETKLDFFSPLKDQIPAEILNSEIDLVLKFYVRIKLNGISSI